jgi:hypothetical protein
LIYEELEMNPIIVFAFFPLCFVLLLLTAMLQGL